MTPQQAAKEVDRLSRAGRVQLQRFRAVSERSIRKTYRKAAGRIANTIQLTGEPPARLIAIQKDLKRQIDILNRRITKKATGTVEKSVDLGIKATVNSVNVYQGLLPGNYRSHLTPNAFQRIHNGAMRSLMTSPVDGIALSDRIWDLHQTTLRRMKRVIADGYIGGLTNSQVQAQVKSLLIRPNVDMRTKFWKDFFKKYPPGKGVYRSAYLNTRRILRTEVNEAYRRAGVGYAKEKSWVAGVRWNLVAGHPDTDVCSGSWELVLTSEGWTQIKNVKKGSSVLSHLGAYKKVLRTMSRTIQNEQIVILSFCTGKGHIRTLALTPNHPVLTDQGWVRAGLLRKGMQAIDPLFYNGGMQHPQEHGGGGRGRQGSGGNATCRQTGNNGAGLYDASVEVLRKIGRQVQHYCASTQLFVNRDTYNYLLVSRLPNSHLISLYAQELSVRGIHQNGGTYQDGGSRNSDCPAQTEGHKHENNISVDYVNRGQKLLHMFRRQIPALYEKLSNNPLNRNGGNSPWLPKTLNRIFRKPYQSVSVEQGQHTYDHKTEALRGEKDVRALEELVYHKAHINYSCLYFSMPGDEKQRILSVDVRTVKKLKVYNLEVETDNSYVVNGIPVHNCDDIASADDYGLGSGVYTPDATPITPHSQCYSDDTEFLTNNGFKFLGEITKEDTIFSMNPKTLETEYVKWEEKVEYYHKGKMAHFKARGFDALVTLDHNMIVRHTDRKKEEYKLLPAEEALDRYELTIPTCGKWSGESGDTETGLWAMLMGWFVSEGCVTKRGPNWHQLTIAQEIPANRIRIMSLLDDMGIKFRADKLGMHFNGAVAKEIYQMKLGKSHEKHVPQSIKDSNVDIIKMFLNEYNLGDGSHRTVDCFGFPSEGYSYYTSSKRLVDDLCELILKTGQSPRVYLHSPKGTISNHYNGPYAQSHDVFRITQSKSKHISFRENRGMKELVDYNGNVQCLSLERNHVLCFRRNGMVSWAGNCLCYLTMVPKAELMPE